MKPVDGLNVFAMSLGDVLYDPETKSYYVTNTNKQVDMQSISHGAETEEIDGLEHDSEERYNHNHDSDGRFTFGVDKNRKHGKIKKQKYAPSPQRQHKGLQLKPAEYAMLCGAFNTAHPSAMNDDGERIFYYGKYAYRVQPDGYGGLIVWDKRNIIATERRKGK